MPNDINDDGCDVTGQAASTPSSRQATDRQAHLLRKIRHSLSSPGKSPPLPGHDPGVSKAAPGNAGATELTRLHMKPGPGFPPSTQLRQSVHGDLQRIADNDYAEVRGNKSGDESGTCPTSSPCRPFQFTATAPTPAPFAAVLAADTFATHEASPRNFKERIVAARRAAVQKSPLKASLQRKLEQCYIDSAPVGQAALPVTEPAQAASKRRRSTRGVTKWEEQLIGDDEAPAQESTWVPPVSPFGLIEEQLYHSPWKLLLACLLLNKTTATQVRKVWPELMRLCPDPHTAAKADPADIEAVIRPLGFHRFRARAVVAMSSDFLGHWQRPSQLRYIGKYASDAYFIFCRGKWRGVHPEDKDLKRYHDWLLSHGGQSTGMQRDELL